MSFELISSSGKKDKKRGKSAIRGGGFELITPAYSHGSEIPRKYTGTGEDLSPPLKWNQPPNGTNSFVIIMEDSDTPNRFVHWLVYDIAPNIVEAKEGMAREEAFPKGHKQGMNDFNHIGYNGPLPPKGEAHHYYIHLYALDKRLNLPSKARRDDVEKAMDGHILERVSILGTFQVT